MQALKAVVILLGVLIVISFVLLIYGFYARMTDPDFTVTKPREEAAPRVGRIAVPAGCAVAEMRPADERLFVRLVGDDEGCNRIMIIDVDSGREIAVFTLGP